MPGVPLDEDDAQVAVHAVAERIRRRAEGQIMMKQLHGHWRKLQKGGRLCLARGHHGSVCAPMKI